MEKLFSYFRQTNIFSTKMVVGLLVLSAAIATLVPYAWARINTGDAWRGVTPELSYDAMFYYARANDVTRGHFYVTNPYFFEHRDDASPVATLNDVIVALPQLLGFSFNTGYYANIFLWALVLLALLRIFFKEHSLHPILGFLGALWCYLGVYGDMLRPGTMQIIYPLYILFLLAFWSYLNRKKGSMLFLAITAGITAYFYIFLFMTVVATLGVYFLVLLWSRNWPDIRRTALVGTMAIGVALPHIINTILLSSREFYAVTLERISLFYSHWPQIEAYYYGRWIVLVLLLTYLLRRYYPDGVSHITHFFITVTGTGILLAMVSNIFTGRDFEIAVHIARFGIMWYLIVGVVIVIPIWVFVFKGRDALPKRVCVGLLFFFLVFQMSINLQRSIPHFSSLKEKFIETQTYAGILDWFRGQPKGVVIAPEDINSYITTVTKHYVLYNSYGGQFILNTDELDERFLLYHAFDNLTLDEFVVRSTEYLGPVPSYLAKTSALRYRLCSLFQVAGSCLAPKAEQSFRDSAAMQKKYADYYPYLAANITQEYAKYHVRYIVSQAGGTAISGKLPLCAPVYHDEWFEVCVVPEDF